MRDANPRPPVDDVGSMKRPRNGTPDKGFLLEGDEAIVMDYAAFESTDLLPGPTFFSGQGE